MKNLITMFGTGIMNLGDKDNPKVDDKYSFESYSGGVYKVWGENWIINLSGLDTEDFDNNPIMLNNHDRDKAVGVILSYEKENTLKTISRFTDATKLATETKALVDDGILKAHSIGIEMKKVKYLADTEEAEVNGQTFKGPGYIVEESNLKEISICSIGKDRKALRLSDCDTQDDYKSLLSDLNIESLTNKEEANMLTPEELDKIVNGVAAKLSEDGAVKGSKAPESGVENGPTLQELSDQYGAEAAVKMHGKSAAEQMAVLSDLHKQEKQELSDKLELAQSGHPGADFTGNKPEGKEKDAEQLSDADKVVCKQFNMTEAEFIESQKGDK